MYPDPFKIYISAALIEKISVLLSNAEMHYPTIEETRLARLLILKEEYGGVAALAEVLGMSNPSQLSQWLNRSPDSKTGKPRSVNSASARDIEKKTGKLSGWMDQPVYADNEKLTQAIDILTGLPKNEIEKIAGIINIYHQSEKKIINENGNSK